MCLFLVIDAYTHLRENWQDLSEILALWFEDTAYACVKAGGKIWIQNYIHYVHLLYRLQSTDINYVTSRWFLL